MQALIIKVVNNFENSKNIKGTGIGKSKFI